MSCSITFFPPEIVPFDIMWKNIVEPDRPQIVIWCTRTACWIPDATNTQSDHMIRTAFPLQQSLHEHASTLRYTCIACLVIIEAGCVFCEGENKVFVQCILVLEA